MLKTKYRLLSTALLTAMLLSACAAQEADQELLTDDNQLLEQMPFPIKVVDCGKVNMKITEPSDIAFAEFILGEREGKE